MSSIKIVCIGLLIPFLGTTLGSSCVFFLKDKIGEKINIALLGFASGVMMAAAVWSLLIPALEQTAKNPFPCAIGLLAGVFFLLFMDRIVPHIHAASQHAEGPNAKLKKLTMLVFAVTLHNIPEGMAVGVVFAGFLNNMQTISITEAFALSIGIALQNFPEGAIISLPLKTEGGSKKKAFIYGTLSGIVEPIASLITIALTGIILNALPWMLSFAAGAMIYVIVEELLPESGASNHSDIGTIGFAFGFVLMMVLDVMLG
ncbi:MAG: ZIP family metal transporter [Treponema sp.]|nr:ZIP family metal transporter [Treponema sp.]